jgi:rhamnosyltransferase subunit B
MERRGRPLVFTWGTGNEQFEEFLSIAENCCRQLELPGVALCPRGVHARRSSADLLVCSFIPLGVLLPGCRLLVHHGGIGTAARALQAGLPQLIVPQRFDQPDNAERLVALGVAEMLHPEQLSVASLCGAIRSLLACEDVPRRITDLGRSLRGEQAVADCVSLMESDLVSAA